MIVGASIAVLMLIINGLRWLISDEAKGRMEARNAILYIIAGILVMVIAIVLVRFVLGGSINC